MRIFRHVVRFLFTKFFSNTCYKFFLPPFLQISPNQTFFVLWSQSETPDLDKVLGSRELSWAEWSKADVSDMCLSTTAPIPSSAVGPVIRPVRTEGCLMDCWTADAQTAAALETRPPSVLFVIQCRYFFILTFCCNWISLPIKSQHALISSQQVLRISGGGGHPRQSKRSLFVCRHGERMDVVFGKHWLSLCSDSKGEDDVNLFKPNVTSVTESLWRFPDVLGFQRSILWASFFFFNISLSVSNWVSRLNRFVFCLITRELDTNVNVEEDDARAKWWLLLFLSL